MTLTIPNEPATPLNNYLTNLIEAEDNVGHSIYFKNASEFVKELWSEMILIIGRNLNARQTLLEKFGTHDSCFYACKNGRKAVSIQTLSKLLYFWQEISIEVLDATISGAKVGKEEKIRTIQRLHDFVGEA